MQFSTEMHHKYAYILYMNCFIRSLAVTNMATVRIFELSPKYVDVLLAWAKVKSVFK